MSLRSRGGFWKGRSVLVTGHTGFKGGWLSLLLAELGARVTGLALPPDAGHSFFAAARVPDRITSRFGDIRDIETVQRAFAEADPEVVFHLAAQALVLPSYERPIETYATNVLGTAHVLDAARTTKNVRAALVVTSDKVYENVEREAGYSEDDRLGGRDPYSSSKACAELVSHAYRSSYLTERGVAVATARAGNVIGGGDFAPYRIVPDFFRSVTAGSPLQVRNPASVRPWQHVLEPLDGYLLLAQKLLEEPEVAVGSWNFGPDAASFRSVGTIVEALTAAWGQGASWRHQPSEQAHESRLLTLDARKAEARLGWRRRLGYDDGVRWTVDWYKAYATHQDPAAFSLAQIHRYSELSS